LELCGTYASEYVSRRYFHIATDESSLGNAGDRTLRGVNPAGIRAAVEATGACRPV
jgi:hypothetical protein